MLRPIRLPSRVLLVVVGLLGPLAWLGWLYFRALGQAFSDSPADPESVDIIIASAFAASIACSAVALVKSTSAARWFALAPLALVALGELGINLIYQQRRAERRDERAVVAEKVAARVAKMPRTYVWRDNDDAGREYFLFVDERAEFLMHVQRATQALWVRCVGRLQGRTLSIAKDTRLRQNAESYLSMFTDEQARTPLDNFDVMYVERLDTSRCDAKSY